MKLNFFNKNYLKLTFLILIFCRNENCLSQVSPISEAGKTENTAGNLNSATNETNVSSAISGTPSVQVEQKLKKVNNKIEENEVGKNFKFDKSILLDEESAQMNSLFKDMIVVQRRAISRSEKYILDTSFNLDYSDTPRSMNGFGLGLGYGLNENYEMHFLVQPFFISNNKPIVNTVQNLQLIDGNQATLYSPSPKLGLEVSLLWIMAYGKDAWGPYKIIRSDTFMKLLGGVITYDGGKSGSKVGLMIGKTLFIDKNINFRISFGVSQIGRYVNNQLINGFAGNIEPQLVWFF